MGSSDGFAESFIRHFDGPGDATDALRWRKDPFEPGSDGSDSPERRLQDAQRQLFRRTPPAGAAEIAERARQERDVMVTAIMRAEAKATAELCSRTLLATAPPSDRSEVGGGVPVVRPVALDELHRRRSIRWGIGTALIAAICTTAGLLIGRHLPPRPQPVSAPMPASQQRIAKDVLDSGGALTAGDYFQAFPDAVPAPFGDPVGDVFRRQSNVSRSLFRVRGSAAAVLVFVTCESSGGRGFEWSIRAGARVLAEGSGPCGMLSGEPALLTSSRGENVELRAYVPGVNGYSVTVLQR